jgi:hypothetical protein
MNFELARPVANLQTGRNVLLEQDDFPAVTAWTDRSN